MTQTRVSKLLAERGICSRREADTFIERGWVTIDGKPVALGEKVEPDQIIDLHPRAKRQQDNRVTILLNKPIGYVSGQAEKSYQPAVTLVQTDNCINPKDGPDKIRSVTDGLAPAGRLDIDSQGLLVLTQDGRVARTLIAPDNNIEKEYIVRIRGQVNSKKIKLLRHGLTLDDRILKPAKISQIEPGLLNFTLREGRKRQIRRMCDLVDLDVIFLKRVRVGKVQLGNLPIGKWRFLRNNERFN